MKRFLITVCMLGLIALQAAADDFDRIIDIKLHSAEYLWAQARTSVKDDAVKLAQDQLVDELNAWIRENSSQLTASRLLKESSVICVKKGDLYLALAYLPIADIAKIPAVEPAPALEPQPAPEATVNSDTQLVQASPNEKKTPRQRGFELDLSFPSDNAIAQILNIKNITVLKESLNMDESIKPYCTWGEIDASTKPSDLNDAYLVIYNPENEEIVSMLSPRSPKRLNMSTGKPDSTSNYPGHKAIWINVTD